jgi:tetratricopeptide (TPR) repeat protein
MIEDLTTPELIQKGRDAYSRDAYSTALMYFRAALERAPKYADVRQLAGVCLNLLGNPEEALAEFDQALRINPRYAEALVNRALTLQELGRYDEAQEAFHAASEADMEEGVDRFPAVLAAKLANQHADIGDLYAAGGALPEAAEQYRRALEIRPRFADIRCRLARVLVEMGDTPGAVRELETALRVNPGFREARINLGLAWYRSGDRAAAAREWERCREEDPDNAQVKTFLAMLARDEL